MIPRAQIQFLQEKIHELRSALFFSMSTAVLRMPTCIVSALQVDEVGQVWFFINRPVQQVREFDREFPARLEFFRKGMRYFLKASGRACIVDDPEDINSLVSVPDEIKTKAIGEFVLIKFRIQHAEYYENNPAARPSWMKTVQTQLKKLLFKVEPGYRPYRLNPESLVNY
jgi:hypothetical protein